MNMNNMMGAIPGMADTAQMGMDAQMQAQEQEQLQARGMQPAAAPNNAATSQAQAVASGIYGDMNARNNSTKGLI